MTEKYDNLKREMRKSLGFEQPERDPALTKMEALSDKVIQGWDYFMGKIGLLEKLTDNKDK